MLQITTHKPENHALTTIIHHNMKNKQGQSRNHTLLQKRNQKKGNCQHQITRKENTARTLTNSRKSTVMQANSKYSKETRRIVHVPDATVMKPSEDNTLKITLVQDRQVKNHSRLEKSNGNSVINMNSTHVQTSTFLQKNHLTC